jgi:hypothetical protein
VHATVDSHLTLGGGWGGGGGGRAVRVLRCTVGATAARRRRHGDGHLRLMVLPGYALLHRVGRAPASHVARRQRSRQPTALVESTRCGHGRAHHRLRIAEPSAAATM